MEKICITCGDPIEGDSYTDGGIMAMTHGWVQCRPCYSKDHKFCPKCKNQPLLLDWKACPKCGTKVS